MSRAARAATFPNTGNSYTPSGHIWFESSRRTRDGNIDIIEVFSEGRTVTPRRAKLLWVPTDAGRRLGNVARNKPRDLTPSTFGQQLQYIPIRGRSRNARVVARLVLRRDPTVTVFIGLRRVRLRRRLRLDSIWQRGITRYEGQRNRAWERFYQTEARGIEKRRARFRRELVRAVL